MFKNHSSIYNYLEQYNTWNTRPFPLAKNLRKKARQEELETPAKKSYQEYIKIPKF